jgi:hypothetical protein
LYQSINYQSRKAVVFQNWSVDKLEFQISGDIPQTKSRHQLGQLTTERRELDDLKQTKGNKKSRQQRQRASFSSRS